MSEWKCITCDKIFDRKANYDRHCKTKYHIRRVEKNAKVRCSTKIEKTPEVQDLTFHNSKENAKTAKGVAATLPSQNTEVQDLSLHNATLLDMIKKLQSELNELKQRPASPQQHSPISLAPVPNKKYTINQLLCRKDTGISLPTQKWKTFLNTAYYSEHEAGIIECSAKHIEKAANLLLGKLQNTEPDQLPIIVLNKKSGVEKKVAYYEGDDDFIIRSGITKKTNVQLYNCLDVYLSRSVGQLWYEPHLKEIYRTLPIEIRNKVHYRGDEQRIGFLDFMCLEKPAKKKSNDKKCRHFGCWNSKLYDGYADSMHHVFWKWKNRDLINVDGGTFKLNDEDFNEFRSDFAEHVMNHEYYQDYLDYRNNQQNCYFSTEVCAVQEDVLEELFIQVCILCNVNEIIKLN